VVVLPEKVRLTMSIHEPATLLTDYLLAGLAGCLAWLLQRRMLAASLAARWWSRVLWLTATSAFVGGSYHGFAPDFPPPVAGAWWLVTLLIVCLLSAVMALSLLHEAAPPDRHRFWPGVIAVKFAAFAGAAIAHPVFIVVIIDYGLAMLAWAVAAVILHRAWRNWMLAAIALSIIAALAQQMRWDLSARFNHNDLYHVIQALALFGFYRAGLRFTGRTDPARASATAAP
jgi:hypothetical protein